jgi:hypothetical protein
MPDVDDLGVIRELLTAKPPSQDVNDHVRTRLNAVIAAAESHTDAMRESVHGTNVPAQRIVSRRRAVRARWRIPIVAGALAAAAAAAVAVTALLPSGHPGSHPARARLAAWTVARQASGDIDITIRQLKNPEGLQSRLRADRLPANVSFSGPGLSRSCQAYATTEHLLNDVFKVSSSGRGAFLVINLSALPTGSGVGIFDDPGAGGPVPSPKPGALGRGTGIVTIPLPAAISGQLAVGLVHASRPCTG